MSANELYENVNNAVLSIEKALDSRFEADTTLYISKEDVDKIKNCLANNNYQNISAMAAKLGSKVVAKVILKNSWLIDFVAISKKGGKKKLLSIFDDMEDSYFLTIAENVIQDRVYTQLAFKEFIESIFYKKISIKACKKNYENNNLKTKFRAMCFTRHIEQQYIMENSGVYTLRHINQIFEQYPDIERYTDFDLISRIANNIEDKNDAAKWIIENKINRKTERIWLLGLLSLGTVGFDASISYISKMQGYRNDISRQLIEKIVPKFFSQTDNISHLLKKTVDLYSDFDECRYSLIKMLTPSSFFDKDLANTLLGLYEERGGIPASTSKFVSEIKSWEKEIRVGYKTIDQIQKAFEGNHNLSNHGTLAYFSGQLSKTDINLVMNFYDDSDKEDHKIKVVLSYFIANSYKRKVSSILESKQFTTNYIGCISSYIESERIKTAASKSFLEKNRKFDIISKLFER